MTNQLAFVTPKNPKSYKYRLKYLYKPKDHRVPVAVQFYSLNFPFGF